MKKILSMVFCTVILCAPVFAAEESASADYHRYQYNRSQNLVFDTATGKAYQFYKYAGEFKHLEIDFIKGTIRKLRDVPLKEGEYLNQGGLYIIKSDKHGY